MFQNIYQIYLTITKVWFLLYLSVKNKLKQLLNIKRALICPYLIHPKTEINTYLLTIEFISR
jgi:hypothetical protein